MTKLHPYIKNITFTPAKQSPNKDVFAVFSREELIRMKAVDLPRIAKEHGFTVADLDHAIGVYANADHHAQERAEGRA